MEKLLSVLASPLPFILLISVVITVHELGHYWVGRMFNAAAESFSIGFGKPIFEVKDKRGTRWRLNWIPLGGFVSFVDETPSANGEKKEQSELVGRAFTALGPMQRLAITLGGPAANFVFAIFVFAAIGMGLGREQAREVRVAQIEAGSAAELAGFEIGDVMVSAGGRQVLTANDVTRATILRGGEEVRYQILRDGQLTMLTAIPIERMERNEAFQVTEKVGRLGLRFEHIDVSVRRLNPIESVAFGVATTGDALASTLTVMRRLVTGLDGLEKMNGPVGIFTLTDNVTDLHMKQPGVDLGEKLRQVTLRLIELSALLSIGVGFFNLLPIPILDGGRAVMCVVEAITRRDIPAKVVRVSMTVGMACILGFFLIITWQDVNKLPWWPGGS